MKGTNEFKSVIKTYLDSRAEIDSLFAVPYGKQDKNIDSCVDFIIDQVKESGICGFADDEIYSMAIHYYNEDNLADVERSNCNVVVNHHVELSSDEIAKAKLAALDGIIQNEKNRLLKKATKNKIGDGVGVGVGAIVEQMSLF